MTRANSSNAPNTNVKHTPVHTSMAFVYETGGRDALIPDVCVAIVSKVVTPEKYRKLYFDERKKKIQCIG